MSNELVIQSENDELLRKRFHIPVETLFKQFESHLQIENNLRIFFSAKFGSGKTYFLNEFFEAHKEKYVVIKLYPVSYSTASNRDIFELIKFDILFHILSEHSNIVEKSPVIKNLLKIQFFISDFINKKQAGFLTEVFNILSEVAIVDPVTKLGTTKIISTISEASTEYENFKKEIQKDDTSESKDFLKRVLEIHPEYCFDDPIGQIICNSIEKLQSEIENRKEVVLLIDDMDRLDPDHLFRILNVFGNHFSESNISRFFRNENKFGFNKIITVGDIINIQSIFAHRYGEKADFRGYFSKYYSKREFNFKGLDNIDNEKIGTLLPRLKLNSKLNKAHLNEDYLNEIKNTILAYIFNILVKKPENVLRYICSFIDSKEIEITVNQIDEQIINDLNLEYYYMVRYIGVLFGDNISILNEISTSEVPVNLGIILGDPEAQNDFLASAVALELFHNSDEFKYLYINQVTKDYKRSMLFDFGKGKYQNVTVIFKYQPKLTSQKFSISFNSGAISSMANVWDLIKNGI